MQPLDVYKRQVHKLTVRPLSDGSYQYVSNEVEDSEDNLIPESPGN